MNYELLTYTLGVACIGFAGCWVAAEMRVSNARREVARLNACVRATHEMKIAVTLSRGRRIKVPTFFVQPITGQRGSKRVVLAGLHVKVGDTRAIAEWENEV